MVGTLGHDMWGGSGYDIEDGVAAYPPATCVHVSGKNNTRHLCVSLRLSLIARCERLAVRPRQLTSAVIANYITG